MLPVSGINPGASRPLAEAGRMNKESPGVQNPEEDKEKRFAKPDLDEYIPDKNPDPAGRCRPGKNEEDLEQDDGAEGPLKAGKSPEEKSEKCVGNTDQVDREIEKLKKRQKELKQQMNSETDEAKIKDLERQLAQVERELSQKDNDAYRRRHTKFT